MVTRQEVFNRYAGPGLLEHKLIAADIVNAMADRIAQLENEAESDAAHSLLVMLKMAEVNELIDDLCRENNRLASENQYLRASLGL